LYTVEVEESNKSKAFIVEQILVSIIFLPEIKRKVFHYLRKALNKNIRRNHYFNIWSNLQEKK